MRIAGTEPSDSDRLKRKVRYIEGTEMVQKKIEAQLLWKAKLYELYDRPTVAFPLTLNDANHHESSQFFYIF